MSDVAQVKRGDLATIVVSGGYGKPRPALVIRADAFNELGSLTVLRLTSELHDWPSFRVTAVSRALVTFFALEGEMTP